MPRSTASGLRITPEVAAFYNYQIHPPSVEAEVSMYAKGAPPRRDFTGFRSRRQREEDEREGLGVDMLGQRCRDAP
jgi:hypothetical protein